MLPRHTLSSNMVWNAGDGPWWAPTAEIIKNTRICAQLSNYKADSTRWICCEYIQNIDRLTSGGILFTRFHPAHLGTSRHKLSVQGCLELSSSGSYIPKCTFCFGARTLTEMDGLTHRAGKTQLCLRYTFHVRFSWRTFISHKQALNTLFPGSESILDATMRSDA